MEPGYFFFHESSVVHPTLIPYKQSHTRFMNPQMAEAFQVKLWYV